MVLMAWTEANISSVFIRAMIRRIFNESRIKECSEARRYCKGR